MEMEQREILMMYRDAKYKLKQIKILADLNECEQSEIADILREAGCELPKRFRPKAVRGHMEERRFL